MATAVDEVFSGMHINIAKGFLIMRRSELDRNYGGIETLAQMCLEKMYTARLWLSGCTFEAATLVNRCKTYIVWWDSYSCRCTSLWNETKDNCSDQTPEQQWHFCNQRSLSDCSCFIRSNVFLHWCQFSFRERLSNVTIHDCQTNHDTWQRYNQQQAKLQHRHETKQLEASWGKTIQRLDKKIFWKGTKPINRRPLLSFFDCNR